jgi:hypothetical protein
MARLSPVTASAVEDPDVKGMLERLGDDVALGIYAHCPELLKPFWQFLGRAKYGGRLPFPLKELVRLRIAELNDCER